ncbi:hypothetical protein GIB67_017312 [Kingdonia uniflora]|uniref:Uncharacterized protein n=1 Tax=Kingdonia uniflora TaxID=39325 RepID=A0A7J7N5W4_9MAGN|nr:hypothetical protein GIB67_017312 [Kingdonia uniflora]
MAPYSTENSSGRPAAVFLSLVSAIVLSPLYMKGKTGTRYYDARWNSSSSFVLPMFLAGLIFAIRVVSAPPTSSLQQGSRGPLMFTSRDASFGQRSGSSWRLAGILVLLLLVVSWQGSVQGFFWR